MDANELQIQLDQRGCLYLTMNRPEVHNAFDDAQIARLTNALVEAKNNPKVKLVVLQSTGRNFCAGADLNYMKRMGQNTLEENQKDAEGLAQLMCQLNFFPKPTIIKANGAVYGGGVGLLCCADIVIGTPYTKVCLSEVKVGMVPATISPYVVAAIGERMARKLFVTAEVVQGEDAKKVGYIHTLVEVDELDAVVEHTIEQIVKNAPQAVQKSKAIALEVSGKQVEQSIIKKTIDCIAEVRNSKEGKEGLSAFLEKRTPNW